MTTDLTALPLAHRPGCQRPKLGTFVGRGGDQMLACRTCRAAYPLADLEALAAEAEESEPQPAGRYAMTCVGCDATMHLPNQRKRVPLCAECRGQRERKSRRREAEEER